MSRVKFNVTSEYAYIQNFKILQSEYSLDAECASATGLCQAGH